jgi:hypothetical protein
MASHPQRILDEVLKEIATIEDQPGTADQVRELNQLADGLRSDIADGKTKVSSVKARRLLHPSRTHGL